MIWLAVIVGGAFGSLLRHGVNVLFGHLLSRATPYATATVNLVGAGIIGLLAGLIATGRLEMSATVRAFVFVGILGGFTTFSSYMLDTLTLSYTGEPGLAFLNVAVQTLFGLAAVWAGYSLGVAIR
jgi:CrcB protein